MNCSTQDATCAQPNAHPIRISIISNVRFVRECLAELLPRAGMISISGVFPNVREAIQDLAHNQPHIILLDSALPHGLAAVEQIRAIASQHSVIAFAVTETAEEVISWAEAGAAGYIPRTAGIADIVAFLVDRQDEEPCPARVIAGLLRRIADGGRPNGGHQKTTALPELTSREVQIAQMIAAGLSNKDIARRLRITLATAKTHVHNILVKLNVQRRGQAASWMRRQSDALEA